MTSCAKPVAYATTRAMRTALPTLRPIRIRATCTSTTSPRVRPCRPARHPTATPARRTCSGSTREFRCTAFQPKNPTDLAPPAAGTRPTRRSPSRARTRLAVRRLRSYAGPTLRPPSRRLRPFLLPHPLPRIVTRRPGSALPQRRHSSGYAPHKHSRLGPCRHALSSFVLSSLSHSRIIAPHSFFLPCFFHSSSPFLCWLTRDSCCRFCSGHLGRTQCHHFLSHSLERNRLGEVDENTLVLLQIEYSGPHVGETRQREENTMRNTTEERGREKREGCCEEVRNEKCGTETRSRTGAWKPSSRPPPSTTRRPSRGAGGRRPTPAPRRAPRRSRCRSRGRARSSSGCARQSRSAGRARSPT